MKTFKQLINEVTRVRNNAKMWNDGANSILSVVPSSASDSKNIHFRAGQDEALMTKKGRKGALSVTRRDRVRKTKENVARIARNLANTNRSSPMYQPNGMLNQ